MPEEQQFLFNNNFEFKILKQESDRIGNLLKLEVFVKNKYTILQISIYGPNKDSPEFYRSLDEDIRDFHGDFIIIGGDFYLVQHTNLDYNNYKNINHQKSRDIVLQLKEKHNLTDPWRIKHEDTRRYTWFNNNPVNKARLDFFLISNELMALVDKTDIAQIIPLLNFICLYLRKGFLEIINSLLKDPEYIQGIKTLLLGLKQQYAAAPYNPNEIYNIDNEHLVLTMDDQSFFELLLLQIRGYTISYSTAKKKKKNERLKILEKNIIELENSISSNLVTAHHL